MKKSYFQKMSTKSLLRMQEAVGSNPIASTKTGEIVYINIFAILVILLNNYFTLYF